MLRCIMYLGTEWDVRQDLLIGIDAHINKLFELHLWFLQQLGANVHR